MESPPKFIRGDILINNITGDLSTFICYDEEAAVFFHHLSRSILQVTIHIFDDNHENYLARWEKKK